MSRRHLSGLGVYNQLAAEGLLCPSPEKRLGTGGRRQLHDHIWPLGAENGPSKWALEALLVGSECRF